MSEYPNIERDVPAWASAKTTIEEIIFESVRAIQRPLEERIAVLERKLSETGPWPADFPASSGELADLIRAVVLEMDRETVLTCYTDLGNVDPPVEDRHTTVDLDKAISEPAPQPAPEIECPPAYRGHAPYGYCPICADRGIRREQFTGNDTCHNGHVYPSRDALLESLPATSYSAKAAPGPDLAERLAREAAMALGENDGRLTGLEILLPLFRRAVEGRG